jgi:hypothetical protein
MLALFGSCTLRSKTMCGFTVRFFSRASEIALSGNFPYWLDTVLGGFPALSNTAFFRRLIPLFLWPA